MPVTKNNEKRKKNNFFPSTFVYSSTRCSVNIQMVNKAEKDTFMTENKKKSSLASHGCYWKWWNQKFRSQKLISHLIESFYFHALVIFLVIVDTALVITEIILDSLKYQYECQIHIHHVSNHRNELMKERLELAMEIAHFASIAILSFFVIELTIRIFARGREFWNIRRRKMEYFDAIIVITSLIIDLWSLRGENKLLGEQLIFVLAFRLWRFIRIISSVTEATLHRQRKHKERLNHQYLLVIRRLIELLVHKTTHTENYDTDNLDSLLEHFRMIDEQCQSSFEALDQNQELTCSSIITQFLEEINGLEQKNKSSVISAMFAKSSEV
ncbi:hypothetical protein I4U23_027907 [Adineta vaga]|nr:hypothetical protein I4U23_027907 [Adineta vaga]